MGGGETCASLSEAAATIEADEFLCTDVALTAQGVCCPSFNMTTVDEGSMINPDFNETMEGNATVTTPCSVCADGLTVSDNTQIPYPEANGATCAQTVAFAQSVEESSDLCTTMKNAESICCPEPSANPCAVCADGITVDGTTPIFDGAVKTCADVIIDALTFDESSETCAQMKSAELNCCPESVVNATTIAPSSAVNETESVAPTITPSLNATAAGTNETVANVTATCEVCPDGITADESIVIGEGKTCGNLIADAALTDANDVGCSMMQDAQLTCCPTPADDPCAVCPDGITVEETTEITAVKTCADLLVDALNTENESDICSGMKEIAEPICCPEVTNTTAPSSATNTSSVAPSAASAGDEDATLSPSSTSAPTPANTEEVEVTESTLAPATTVAPSALESSTASSSLPTIVFVSSTETTIPTVLGATEDEEADVRTASPTSLAPSTASGVEPTDKEPLAFENPGTGGEVASSGSSRRVGFFAAGCAMIVGSFAALF